MTAWDWAVVVAVGALLIVASSYRRRDSEADDQAAWQASTAVRTEADIRRDLDAAKADRWQVEQQAFDQTFTQIIATEYPKTLPHQRQPRKDQP